MKGNQLISALGKARYLVNDALTRAMDSIDPADEVVLADRYVGRQFDRAVLALANLKMFLEDNNVEVLT